MIIAMLTDTFKQHVDKLREYYYKNYCLPSFSEAMSVFWVKSKGALSYIFLELQEYGLINKVGKKYTATDTLVWIPYYESVQAWLPTDVTSDNDSTTMNINSLFVKNPSKTMIVSVNWDSMIEEWIKDGDMVVVDTSKQAKEWDMVIATVDGGNTLKILTRDNKGVQCLQAANQRKFPDLIYPEYDMKIAGLVVGSFRIYQK